MKTQLTPEGHAKLQEELAMLAETKRPQAVERLAKARSMGDLSENSEYSAAKEEVAFVEGRIREVETILKNSEVVNGSKSSSKVSLGSKVKVKSSEGEEEYEIVGEFEANPLEQKLSSTSPIGKALLGKVVGEKAEVAAPGGSKVFTVVSIN